MSTPLILSKLLTAPLFPRGQALDMIPGLGVCNFGSWVKARIVTPMEASRGKGRAASYSPHDIIQFATIHELARQGFPLRCARLVWLTVVLPRLMERCHRPDDPADMAALLVPHAASGEVVHRPLRESGGDAGLDHPKAPNVFTVFRVDAHLDFYAARISAVLHGEADPITEPHARVAEAAA
ncbi:hypothetical protein JMJ56_31490 [Belnapia sp. T18]|uniref:HTH merR-type domain-containing protein n=1 Tax=Belnapia arida TaxID=2804533 RepID=A0ABS1UFM1_9PROT|nr:hypothetical protein [Belnapia arida]MBL6082492.1 hypothetical protein [Belnapia arida]